MVTDGQLRLKNLCVALFEGERRSDNLNEQRFLLHKKQFENFANRCIASGDVRLVRIGKEITIVSVHDVDGSYDWAMPRAVADQFSELVKALHRKEVTGGSAVDHPKHYNSSESGVECIDVVEHMTFNIGNAVKYLWRAGLKGDAVEDMRKAIWYIEREIKRLEKTGK